ncbi:hypothetical protein K5V21_17390 [Clostridium sardiniense]|uniref:WxL domain-containing protein n=1 Tax=Clostridium sardiniense TaxID=29369 RepID=A0ABS7L2A0_CLOSR|nr:hypothetical protein [Clostridium sardiniense]MBY0757208.1 hypothetical protein [Clostridium sardiniense]MDQ0462057.1 hypothetical protein [Clostridium sardiniense]
MKKKILALAICAASTSMLSGVTAFAATGSQTVPVTYDASTSIPDPDNPGAPTYQVVIPSAISFTEVNKPVDASVSLTEGADKNTAYTGESKVNVTVASANGYKVQLADDTDKLDYTLAYGANTNNATVGQLTKTNTTIKGQALLKQAATKTGVHTDTLTYTVETATP